MLSFPNAREPNRIWSKIPKIVSFSFARFHHKNEGTSNGNRTPTTIRKNHTQTQNSKTIKQLKLKLFARFEYRITAASFADDESDAILHNLLHDLLPQSHYREGREIGRRIRRLARRRRFRHCANSKPSLLHWSKLKNEIDSSELSSKCSMDSLNDKISYTRRKGTLLRQPNMFSKEGYFELRHAVT